MPEAAKGAENRTTRRFNMRLPIAVNSGEGVDGELEAQTRDVSSRGVFFYVDSKLKPDTAISFVLTLPPELTMTENIRVRCRGRIVRVDDEPSGRVGVACEIEHYEFLGSDSSSQR